MGSGDKIALFLASEMALVCYMDTFKRRYIQRTYSIGGQIEFYIWKFNPQNDLLNELIDNLPVQETVVGCPIPVEFQLIVSPEILFFMMLKSN